MANKQYFIDHSFNTESIVSKNWKVNFLLKRLGNWEVGNVLSGSWREKKFGEKLGKNWKFE